MVIRRIRDHVATHNWFAVSIDFVIVVAGIVIGTQVNNWNQARIETSQGRDYRQRLIQELDFNRLQFEQQRRYYRTVLNHGMEAIAAVERRSNPSATEFLIDAYQLSQIDTTPPKSYVYNEMVSSGLVSRLGAEEIQEAASDYYLGVVASSGIIGEMYPYRTTIRQVIPFGIQSAIRKSCGDQLVFERNRVVGVKLSDRCTVSVTVAEAEQAAQAVMTRPGMRDEMTRYLASVGEKLDVLGTNIAMTRRFMADLATHQGTSP